MIMNKILYTILALLCIGVASCDNDDAVVELTSLNIREATVDFVAVGGEGFITLGNNSNAEAKVSSSEEWCSIKNVTSDKITFSVAVNEALTTRAATIMISIPGEEKQVSITQSGVVPEYELDNFYAFADNKGFTKTINFTSTLPITVSIEDAAKSWLSYKEIEGGFSFTAAPNESGNAHFGKVTIVSGSASMDYFFLQYGLDDLLGTWNASYSTGEEAATDVIVISKTADGLNLSMQELGYPYIEAVYQDGSIDISCMQIVGVTPRYYLFWGAYDLSDGIVLSGDATCRLTPYLNKQNQWGLTFVDNGSWAYGMQAIAVWAVDQATSSVAGYWDIMYNLSLNK